MAENALADVLTKEALERAAYGQSFERGRRYFEQGRVKALKESGGVVSARVRGSDWYDVELRVEDGELAGTCSCPVGEDGLFCKHCVATGAAWIVSEALSTDERKGAGSPEAVRQYLDELPKKKLVDMLVAQARTDGALRQRLTLAVARSRPSGPDLVSIEAAIRGATAAGEPWSRIRHRDRGRRLEAVVEALSEILAAGDATSAMRLAALGFERSVPAAGPSYYPDAEMAVVAGRFLSLHVRACAAVKPDPAELARWLFEFETTCFSYMLDGLVFKYAELLGEKGLAVYRELAEKAWREAQTRKRRATPGEPVRLDAVAKNAALLTLDPMLMAEVSQLGLDSPWAYYNCANRCLEGKQPDKALAWAELGVKAFPNQPYEALHRLLANEYARRGQLTDALNQVWAMFTCEPGIKNYVELRTLAKKAGQPSVFRDEALEYLKERAARAPKPAPGFEFADERLRCGSLIVEILLKEKNVDAAWREAQAGGCHEETWLKLARAREAGHPADAIGVYQRLAEDVVQGADNEAYKAAVRCLRRAESVIAGLGQSRKFREYLAGFRERHRRKKNLLWLLDREFGPGSG